MKWPGFIGGSFQPQAATADNSRTVNLYVEPSQGQGATGPAALYPSPGFEAVDAVYGGLPRAHFFADGREFVIRDNRLHEYLADGTPIWRGLVGDDRKPATITSNGDINNQLFITSNRNGFIFGLLTNTLTQITALDGLAFQGDFLDGYFLCFDDQTSTLYISARSNGLTWTTGTDFAQRSLRGDPWLAFKVCGRFVWLFGEFTSEVWYNTADTFPFTPHPSGLLNYGIRAAWSPQVIGSAIVWLGKTSTGRVRVIRGESFTPQVISPYALDLRLADAINPSQTYADVFSFAGHTFYVLSIGDEIASWAFDATTETWVEWMSYDVDAGTETAWRGRFHAAAFDENRVLDRVTGKLYRLSLDTALDANGSGIKRIRRCPAPYADSERAFYSELRLDLEPGLGLIADPHGTAPQVMLKLSNDGGKTWPVERWQSAGKLGEYLTRVKWNRLGSARRRVFEVSMTDAAHWRMTGAYLEAEAEGG